MNFTWRDIQNIIRIANEYCNSLDYEKIMKLGEEGYFSEILRRFNSQK